MRANFRSIFFTVLTALLIFTLFPTTTMSQSLGIKGGLSYSDQAYDYQVPSLDIDRLEQTGIVAGLFLSHDFGLFSSMRFEVDYVQKGSSIEVYVVEEYSPAITGTLKIEDRLDYLSVNLLLTPGFFSGYSLSPYLIAGPRADILLNTASEFESLIFDNMRPVVVGLTAGFGIEMPLTGSISLLIEGVYNHDLSYAYDEILLQIKNNTVLLTTGLSF